MITGHSNERRKNDKGASTDRKILLQKVSENLLQLKNGFEDEVALE